jgi:bifunctional ADP-heptose synthase (sugar kinase/adenylyltransferase)
MALFQKDARLMSVPTKAKEVFDVSAPETRS